MYGTIARMRLKPGSIDQMLDLVSEYEDLNMPGHVRTTVYQADADANEYFMAVQFDSREAYEANAQSPEQHQRYLRYRELLEAEPDWHDGTVVYNYP